MTLNERFFPYECLYQKEEEQARQPQPYLILKVGIR
jgi:hypothetical protein